MRRQLQDALAAWACSRIFATGRTGASSLEPGAFPLPYLQERLDSPLARNFSNDSNFSVTKCACSFPPTGLASKRR
jgi:hypothetical protein